MKLSLNRSDNTDTPWLEQSIVDSIREISAALGPAATTVNLVIVGDPYIREINKEFRNIDRTTDVISFSYLDDEGPDTEDDLAGEVYISSETVEREAKELGVNPGILFFRVGVHGLLHVVGYDHESDDDAARMEEKEKSILGSFLTGEQLKALF